MGKGDETADSYRLTAELLLRAKGDRYKIIDSLFKAATLYGKDNKVKAIECLDELYKNLRGSTTEIEIEQYFHYLQKLAKTYENLDEEVLAADIYSDLAREIHKSADKLEKNRTYTHLQILKKFSAYLAKALMLYDSAKRYDLILKLARIYYKEFPILQENTNIHGELFFCYEHIINAADITGSRYFREYYAGLDNKLRGIPFDYGKSNEPEGKIYN